MQPFHPVFRHLWYLSAIVMVGLAVLGFAYEKLSGNMSGLAMLGFTASIVHAAAWWFTLGVTSPLKKFFACGLLFVGAMISSTVGRLSFLAIAEQSYLPLLPDMQFIAIAVSVWWLSLAVVNGIAKELMRWRLNFNDAPISPRTSLADMFQLTAILGGILAFSSSSSHWLVGTDYTTVLLVSVCFHVVLLIPLSMLIMSERRQSLSRSVLKIAVVVGLCTLLLLLVSLRYLGDEFEGASDLAVGPTALVVPYVLMLMWGRESGLSVSSGWFDQR